jgi:hypothetical protein
MDLGPDNIGKGAGAYVVSEVDVPKKRAVHDGTRASVCPLTRHFRVCKKTVLSPLRGLIPSDFAIPRLAAWAVFCRHFVAHSVQSIPLSSTAPEFRNRLFHAGFSVGAATRLLIGGANYTSVTSNISTTVRHAPLRYAKGRLRPSLHKSGLRDSLDSTSFRVV